ncbi:MAG: translation initiation factor IF-3 ['Conium maculatum' witches'-broom phytoplasma]|nr:translation initiation factor IF-3 ['Conium maculatum' witches'-broom phytoplasma]
MKYKKNKKDNLKVDVLFNENIPYGEHLVIDEKGYKLGVFEKSKILDLADSKDIDVVLINGNSNPKVVRLMDYSQFYYDQQKKLKKIKKKQNITVLKKLRISPNIQDNDLEYKVKKVRDFLVKGDKVKITMFFPGRMIVHSELGKKVFQQIISDLKDVSKIDLFPKLEGRQMSALLVPLISKK